MGKLRDYVVPNLCKVAQEFSLSQRSLCEHNESSFQVKFVSKINDEKISIKCVEVLEGLIMCYGFHESSRRSIVLDISHELSIISPRSIQLMMEAKLRWLLRTALICPLLALEPTLPHLHYFPNDLNHSIFMYCSVKELLLLGSANKKLQRTTQIEKLWNLLLIRDFQTDVVNGQDSPSLYQRLFRERKTSNLMPYRMHAPYTIPFILPLFEPRIPYIRRGLFEDDYENEIFNPNPWRPMLPFQYE